MPKSHAFCKNEEQNARLFGTRLMRALCGTGSSRMPPKPMANSEPNRGIHWRGMVTSWAPTSDNPLQRECKQSVRAENFLWRSSIELEHRGQLLDLHNCYSFRSFHHDVLDRAVILKWHRLSDDWVDQTLPAHIQLHIADVTQLTVSPRDPSQPYSEDDCLASFGYDSDEKWAQGQFWVDGEADYEWRWSFVFQSGVEIQLQGGAATVNVGN